jgi:hypothetical protein
MSVFLGVKCKTCGAFIVIDAQPHGAAIQHDLDLESHPCKSCGSRHAYGTPDLIDEAGEKLPYAP